MSSAPPTARGRSPEMPYAYTHAYFSSNGLLDPQLLQRRMAELHGDLPEVIAVGVPSTIPASPCHLNGSVEDVERQTTPCPTRTGSNRSTRPNPRQNSHQHYKQQRSHQNKRFSVPSKLAPLGKHGEPEQRHVTLVRPCESFRDRKEKHSITFGYAALNPDYNDDEEESCSQDAGCSVFTIFSTEGQQHTVCQQPVGQQADIFISTLTDKQKLQLKKFLDNTPRAENEYFVWVKDSSSQVVTVLSIKTLENHLKSKQGIRRVKWRHLSTERLSIYRYSLPSITDKGARVRDCLLGHRKLCLVFIWLGFVLLICITVIVGSLTGNESDHHSPFNATHPGAVGGGGRGSI